MLAIQPGPMPGREASWHRADLRLDRRMFLLELRLEHPNFLKVAILALKSILQSSNISKLYRREDAITLLNQLVIVARPCLIIFSQVRPRLSF